MNRQALFSALLILILLVGAIPSATAQGPVIHPDSPERGQPEAPAHPGMVLWDQPLSTVNQAAWVNQDFPDYPTYSSFLADDFVNAQAWQISTIFVPGDGWNGFSTLMDATALTWEIYADCAGVPCGDPSGGGNTPLWSLVLSPTDPQVVISAGTPGGMPSNATLNPDTPIYLPAGQWWLVFYPTMAFDIDGQYGRQAADTTNGYVGQFINPGGGFGYGTAWQDWTVIGPTQHDIAFRLEGDLAPPVVWEKTIDGDPWHPDMHITRQTSDTITVEEVLHFAPMLSLEGSPFVPVDVTGDVPEGDVWLTSHSPTPLATSQPAAPPNPEAVLWDQPLSTVNQAAYVDQDFPDYPTYSSFLADDFVNPDPWAISTIFIPGDGWNGFSTLFNATALTWQIYVDCAGVPCGDPSGGGNPPVWTLTLAPTDAQVVIGNGTPGGMPSNTTLNLATPIGLPAGHWWLVFYPTMLFSPSGQYGRQPADTANGYVAQFINPGGGFGYGTAWQNWAIVGPAQQDIAFRLEGDVVPVFAQIETWDPAHLQLLDWAATGGNVIVEPDRLTWTGEILGPMTIYLVKWFHVEPGTWTETMLFEDLWLDQTELEQRPVIIVHGYPVYLPVIMRASP